MHKDKKTRIHYSKYFKRKALIDVINGKNFEDVLRSSGYDIDSLIQNDKKYCAKLIHKWKNEVYKNNEIMYFPSDNITADSIKNELDILADDDDYDEIAIEIKEKINKGKYKYNTLKSRVTAVYQTKNKNNKK